MLFVLIGMFFFAAIHTLMADKQLKQSFQNKFGERTYEGLYRLIYNIVALITLAPVMLFIWLGESQVIWQVPASIEPAFLIIQMIGTIGVIISLLQINLGYFSGFSQLYAWLKGDPLPLKSERLKKRGLYRLVRHPLYLFALLSMWPVIAMTDSVLAFNIGATLYFIIGSLWEEKRMVAAYGVEYEAYQAKVPWLIPFVHLKR